MRGELGREIWSQTLRSLEYLDASEIRARRLNAKEVTTPMVNDVYIPIADGTVKLSGGDHGTRMCTLTRDQPERRRAQR